MVTEEQLEENGFEYQDDWNNRSYYNKNGFEIVEHNGDIMRCDDEHWSGYGENMNTIEELCKAYNEWANSRITQHEKELEILKKSI